MSVTPSLLPINEAAITLLNVDVVYEGRQVLSNINQQFRPREFVAVVGGPGSGKSSLLQVIAGHLHPTRGAVLIGAHNVDEVGVDAYHRQVVFIPSGPDQVKALDEATNSNAPVIVVDEARAEDRAAINFGVMRLAGERTIIFATDSKDLISQADYVIEL